MTSVVPDHLMGDGRHLAMITSEDIGLISRARTKNRYTELSAEERGAYGRVSAALQSMGTLLKSKLTDPSKFDVRTTSGFNIDSGVRSYIPKDLWFSVSPTANAKGLAGMPQLFMIVSERGIEYGYGASVSPSDFSQQTVKEIVRKAAPVIFEQLPSPDSSESNGLQDDLNGSGTWYFRRKHRLPPNQSEFPSLKEWLKYLQSPEGKRQSAGVISRYLLPDGFEDADLEHELSEMSRLFEPLLDRDWCADEVRTDGASSIQVETVQIADIGSGEEKIGALGVEEMQSPRVWIEKCVVKDRIDRQSGPHRLGKALWSPQRNKAGRDIYSNMRRVSPGDLVLHLTDNSGITGTSEVAEKVEDSFYGLEGTDWAGIDAYRVQLRNFEPLNPEFPRSEFLSENETGQAMRVLLERSEGQKLFYNRKLELNQGAYLSEAPPELVALLNRAYMKFGGRKLVDLAGLPDPAHLAQPAAREFTIDDALSELFLEREDVERALEIWRNKKNLILTGAPGVGKSFIARQLAYALIGFKDDLKVQAVQFHQSYGYEDFVQGYRPNGNQGFDRKNGTFYEFRDRALRDPDGTYVFIIDEINRGNLSKIFGELMLLIEADKRGKTWKTRLAYAADGDEDFYVPDNLFILGMMNTADRSLSLVDYALRRRFAFVAMEPLYGATKFRAHLEACGIPDDIINCIVNGMGELNQAIGTDRVNLGPGFRIGHSFFTPTGSVSNPEAWYRRIVETEIHPLLEEYWFDSPETADQWRDQLLR